MQNPLSVVRTKIRQMLRDEFVSGSDYEFPDDEIDLHIGSCLVEISQRKAYEVKETLTTTASSKELDISSIEDLIEIPKVEYPTGNEPPDYRNCSIFGNTLRIDTTLTPSADEDVYLYCEKVHQLTEESSTLDPRLEKVLIDGVVAYVASGWMNSIRQQTTNAIATLSSVETALGNVAGRITQSINRLTSGKSYIAKKNSEAITAIGNISARITQAVSDISSGRALIGDKKTEAISAIDAVTGRITQAVNDLTTGRGMISDLRTTADTAIDSMTARIEQAVTDLTSGRDYINKINIGGDPQTDLANFALRELGIAVDYLRQATGYLHEHSPSATYANYAARDLQAAATYLGQARSYLSVDTVTAEYQSSALRELASVNGYLAQARAYLAVDAPASEYGVYSGRELANAVAYLNEANGHIRGMSARLSTIRGMTAYQNWADKKLLLYQGELKMITTPKTYRTYPKS